MKSTSDESIGSREAMRPFAKLRWTLVCGWLPSTSSVTLVDAVPPTFDAVQTYSPASSTLTFLTCKLPPPSSTTLPLLVARGSPRRVHVTRGAGLPATTTHASVTSRPTIDSVSGSANASRGLTGTTQFQPPVSYQPAYA